MPSCAITNQINTVTKFLVDVGTACEAYQLETLKNLPCKRIQCDEIWCFVGAKESNVPPMRKGEFGRGDVYTWVAIDPESKLVASWLVGRRNIEFATIFMQDLAARLAHRVQLTTDGHKAYLEAVDEAFGGGIDYAMLQKLYAGQGSGKHNEERRYRPTVLARR